MLWWILARCRKTNLYPKIHRLSIKRSCHSAYIIKYIPPNCRTLSWRHEMLWKYYHHWTPRGIWRRRPDNVSCTLKLFHLSSPWSPVAVYHFLVNNLVNDHLLAIVAANTVSVLRHLRCFSFASHSRIQAEPHTPCYRNRLTRAPVVPCGGGLESTIQCCSTASNETTWAGRGIQCNIGRDIARKVDLSGNLFHVKSAVSGVEARHKWFETWDHAGH